MEANILLVCQDEWWVSPSMSMAFFTHGDFDALNVELGEKVALEDMEAADRFSVVQSLWSELFALFPQRETLERHAEGVELLPAPYANWDELHDMFLTEARRFDLLGWFRDLPLVARLRALNAMDPAAAGLRLPATEHEFVLAEVAAALSQPVAADESELPWA